MTSIVNVTYSLQFVNQNIVVFSHGFKNTFYKAYTRLWLDAR